MIQKGDWKTKKTKSRGGQKKKGIKLSWLEIAALSIVIFCLGFLLGRSLSNLGEYKGLGEAKEIQMNDYDNDAFKLNKSKRMVYKGEEYEQTTIVDVSYAQKTIDWDKVAADGIDMAMIRLGFRGYSSGTLKLDEYYESNISGAKEAGLKYGVYFFSQAVSVEEAQEEADFVLENIKGKKVKGPVAFDMEPIQGADRITHLTVTEKTEIADAFLKRIEKKGYDAILYGNPSWFKKHVDLSYLTDYPVWLAHYTTTPSWPYQYIMWQYTDKGKVKGISGNVDLSIGLVDGR
ncbi:MAG: glycoside hydrolase family 25 protein [Firmicutes bacterium]|nr:glycoside hydrolase family 25 protein [Bacillota bacterium]